MAGRNCSRTAWSKWAIWGICAANLAQPASAQTVSGVGEVLPGPVVSPNWTVGGDPVSYTHLDVYKRQIQRRLLMACLP